MSEQASHDVCAIIDRDYEWIQDNISVDWVSNAFGVSASEALARLRKASDTMVHMRRLSASDPVLVNYLARSDLTCADLVLADFASRQLRSSERMKAVMCKVGNLPLSGFAVVVHQACYAYPAVNSADEISASLEWVNRSLTVELCNQIESDLGFNRFALRESMCQFLRRYVPSLGPVLECSSPLCDRLVDYLITPELLAERLVNIEVQAYTSAMVQEIRDAVYPDEHPDRSQCLTTVLDEIIRVLGSRPPDSDAANSLLIVIANNLYRLLYGIDASPRIPTPKFQQHDWRDTLRRAIIFGVASANDIMGGRLSRWAIRSVGLRYFMFLTTDKVSDYLYARNLLIYRPPDEVRAVRKVCSLCQEVADVADRPSRPELCEEWFTQLRRIRGEMIKLSKSNTAGRKGYRVDSPREIDRMSLFPGNWIPNSAAMTDPDTGSDELIANAAILKPSRCGECPNLGFGTPTTDPEVYYCVALNVSSTIDSPVCGRLKAALDRLRYTELLDHYLETGGTPDRSEARSDREYVALVYALLRQRKASKTL